MTDNFFYQNIIVRLKKNFRSQSDGYISFSTSIFRRKYINKKFLGRFMPNCTADLICSVFHTNLTTDISQYL